MGPEDRSPWLIWSLIPILGSTRVFLHGGKRRGIGAVHGREGRRCSVTSQDNGLHILCALIITSRGAELQPRRRTRCLDKSSPEGCRKPSSVPQSPNPQCHQLKAHRSGQEKRENPGVTAFFCHQERFSSSHAVFTKEWCSY